MKRLFSSAIFGVLPSVFSVMLPVTLSVTLFVSILFLSGCSAGSTSDTPVNQSSVARTASNDSSQSSQEASMGAQGAPLYDETTEVVKISEKLFVAQSNDVYFNREDYLGKIIHYEGIFTTFEYPETDRIYHTVIRYGPGCCGVDANCGFEVSWQDEKNTFPQEGDWVEVKGVLEEYDAYGFPQLRITLISLKVLDVRGAEYVTK